MLYQKEIIKTNMKSIYTCKNLDWKFQNSFENI